MTMSGRKSVVAVVTARGGSKGLPGKNIADLGGKPLLAWTLEAARASRRIDRLVLSTDSPEIADVGRSWGAEVPFLRPAELATDTAHSPDVVEHAVAFVEKAEGVGFDYAVMLQPTSPFRTAQHIDEAIEKFESSGLDSLIAIKPQDYPPWWMFRLDGERLVAAVPWTAGVNVFNLERQEFPKVYRPNGAFYITHRRRLRERGDLVNPDSCGYYVMNAEDSCDIDTLSDLLLARAILDQRRQTKA
jgi:CMP-N-acetylneuraminic acid synthetase